MATDFLPVHMMAFFFGGLAELFEQCLLSSSLKLSSFNLQCVESFTGN